MFSALAHFPQDAIQEAVPDSVAVPDSADALGQVGRDVGNAVDMLVSGDFRSFWSQTTDFGTYVLVSVIPVLIKAILIFALMYVLYRVLRKVTARTFNRSAKVDVGLENLLLRTLSVVAWTFILVMVLAQFGVNVSALLAGLSIAGIAVGFAAKDSLENFISGITIMIDRPFRVGDQVVVDGTYGTIENITLRSTRLRTLTNEVMVMPNVSMINQKLINHTLHGLLRVDILFGIAYKENPKQARDVVVGLSGDDSRIMSDPPPSVVVTDLGDSSVNMALRLFITDTSLEVPIRFEYTEKVFNALKAADIEIPFPHLQLFIDGADGLKGMPFNSRD